VLSGVKKMQETAVNSYPPGVTPSENQAIFEKQQLLEIFKQPTPPGGADFRPS